MMALTLMPPWPLWLVFAISTLLFVFLSGRMIPGMALVTGAASPPLRGTFMALNASVQSAAMGAASLLGGFIIGRDAQGLVQHYGVAGLVGCCASLGAVLLAPRLKMHGTRHA
jgi:predicted MFS family arabinose efflux permease